MILPEATEVAQAYNLFADDLSKRNFKNRFLYDMTRRPEFILDMTEDAINAMHSEEYDGSNQLKIIKLARNILRMHIDNTVNTKIVVFGAGVTCVDILTYLEWYGISQMVSLICSDNNSDLWGKKISELEISAGAVAIYGSSGYDIEIVAPHDLVKYANDDNVLIIVATNINASEKRILYQLKALRFREEQIISFCGRLDFAIAHDQQYFDKEFIPPFTESDVVVDGGAYDLWTSIIALGKTNGGKVVAFEPDVISYKRCLDLFMGKYDGITIVNAGLYSKTKQLHFTGGGEHGARIDSNSSTIIDVTSIDEYFCENPVTLIKLDVEGAELEALKGAREHILRFKPKLAICVYHKPFDIVEIPLYIASLRDDYRYFIRHYQMNEFETVLYAV